MSVRHWARSAKQILALFLSITLPGCSALSDAFTAHSEIVARAGGQQLTVPELAEIFAVGQSLPLTHDAVDRMARHWVDVVMVARRAAVGDSLGDREIVLESMWPDVRQALMSSFYDLLFAERTRLNPDAVDSAYRAGEMRMLAHVLRRVTPETTPEEAAQQRAVADEIRQRLLAGGSWEEANRHNQDSIAQRLNGSLGLVQRGAMVPQFDSVAFALDSGEISDVTETRFGFHIVYRPRLEEVREQYADALERAQAARFDSAYGEQLLAEKRVEVRQGAPAKIREILAYPLRALGSSEPLATFSGGDFTGGQFVRWLQYLPSAVAQQILYAPDDQIIHFTRRLVLQELLWLQTDSAGLQLSDSIYDIVKAQHQQSLAAVWNAAGIAPDLLIRAGASFAERERIAVSRVNRYLMAVATREGQLQQVQPFLAAQLRNDVAWEIAPAGVERVLEQAGRMRAVLQAETNTER